MPTHENKIWLPQVRNLLRLHRWAAYHTHNSFRSVAGWPDLACVKGDRLLFAELKNEKLKPTPKQTAWLNRLMNTGHCEVFLWRPQHFEAISIILQHRDWPKRLRRAGINDAGQWGWDAWNAGTGVDE